MSVLPRFASSLGRRDEAPNQELARDIAAQNLLKHLSSCRPKEGPQYSEKILNALNQSNRADFIKALENRLDAVSGSGLARLKKVIRQPNQVEGST